MKKYRIIHIILSILFIYTFASFSTPIHAEEKESDSFDTYELIKTDENRVVKNNSIEDRIDYLIKFPSITQPCGTQDQTDDDSTSSVRVSLIIEYDTIGNTVKLTKVSGNWKSLDAHAYVKSAKLIYGCSSISFVTQTATKYPSTPFSYNTGFNTYVEKNFGSDVGANITVTIVRGGSTWNFTLENILLRSDLGLGIS